MNKTTKQLFFEEQKKVLAQYNLKKRKLAEAKKYSLPQRKIPSMGIDTSLLLEWNE